jgi:hypothetical protein
MANPPSSTHQRSCESYQVLSFNFGPHFSFGATFVRGRQAIGKVPDCDISECMRRFEKGIIEALKVVLNLPLERPRSPEYGIMGWVVRLMHARFADERNWG